MVGYSETFKAYRLMDLDTKKIVISRDVIFIEGRYKNSNEIQGDVIMLDTEDIAAEFTEEDINPNTAAEGSAAEVINDALPVR